MPLKRAVCKYCEKPFNYYAWPNRGIYCSRECRLADQNVKVTCANCGEVFKRYRSHTAKVRGFKNDYCNVTCYNEYRTKTEIKPCVICGTEFEVELYKTDRITVCSKECQKENRKRLGRNLRKTVSKVCPACGKTFSEKPSVMKNKTFCNSRCYGDWLVETGARAGENNNGYRDGSTPNTKRRLNQKVWKVIADSIRAQRGNKCEVCGKKNKKHRLPVHHIVPWIISEDNTPQNLLVACQSCHATLDYLYYEKGLTPYVSVYET